MLKFTKKCALAALTTAIILGGGTVQAQTQDATQAQELEEAQRLQSILRRYYSEEAARTSEIAGDVKKGEEVVDGSGGAYSLKHVLLNGAQGVLALQTISRRLTDQAIPAQRRKSDIIFHAEVRRDGTLLSSRSHSLKPLGKMQYVAKISLSAGEAELTVREQEWSVSLTATDSADYVITFSALDDQQLEFHVIPVAELLSTNRTDFPTWLPPIGAAPRANPDA